MDSVQSDIQEWQRRGYAKKKLGDNLFILGNLVTGSLVLSQFLKQPINWDVVIFGIAITLIFYLSAYIILRKLSL